MPFDAVCLQAVLQELRPKLLGLRIDKVQQPARDQVILLLRGNQRLLLNAGANAPRIQLTELTRDNPAEPPMFCMLLRKHLSGGRILSIAQPHLERVVEIRLEALDELGDRVERRLVLEAMGRHSNLILLDGEGRITDCLRRVDGDMSARRQVLPGLFYRLPPAQAKLDPTALDRGELERLLAAAPPQAQADQWLLDAFGGLSPLVCRELACRAGGSTDARLDAMGQEGRRRLLDGLEGLLKDVQENRFTPVMVTIDGRPKDFSFLPLEQYGSAAGLTPFPTFSQLLDQFYEQRENQERIRQRGQDLIRSVTNARDRLTRKLANQDRELTATLDRKRLRQYGDIITSNFHAMDKGMARLRATDFYDPEGREVEIPLDPLLTLQQNAAKYYKEYNKAKTAQRMLTIQMEKGRGELDYLNSVLENITLAEGERDLQEIRQELVDTGYLCRPSKAKGREKRASSKPMEFCSSAGLRIAVGKNNTQNDLLTCKLAAKGDIWLHTQKIHGTHVILFTQGRTPDPGSLQEAACLAAWFSQGRESGKVPVDYTPVKYVKKPGAPDRAWWCTPPMRPPWSPPTEHW